MPAETHLDREIAARLFGWTPECPGVYRMPSEFRQQILSPAGGDTLLSQTCPVCGWIVQEKGPHGPTGIPEHERLIPPYSTDRSLVWDVVDAMGQREWIYKLEGGSYKTFAAFLKLDGVSAGSCTTPGSEPYSMALVVCHAALQALKAETHHPVGVS